MEHSNRQKLKRLKDKLQENNTLTQCVSVIFLILILTGLFAFIILGLRNYGLFKLPDFLERMLFGVSGDNALIRPEHSDIYNILGSGRAEPRGFILDISLENARGIISGTNMPDNLHLETTAVYFINGMPSRTVGMSFWRKGDKHRYIISSNGVPQEIYINNGVHEYIRNYITGSWTRRAAGLNFSFNNVPHIKDVNYYLDLIESGEITTYKIERGREENTITITYEIAELNQRDIIRVSLDNGIVLAVRSYVGDMLFYESVTSVIEAYFTGRGPDNTVLTDDLFVIG